MGRLPVASGYHWQGKTLDGQMNWQPSPVRLNETRIIFLRLNRSSRSCSIGSRRGAWHWFCAVFAPVLIQHDHSPLLPLLAAVYVDSIILTFSRFIDTRRLCDSRTELVQRYWNTKNTAIREPCQVLFHSGRFWDCQRVNYRNLKDLPGYRTDRWDRFFFSK